MEHSKVEEQQIAERYVMGRLPEEEAARFEEHYLTCDECLDRLQLAERFHHALRSAAAEDTTRVTAMGFFASLARLAAWQRSLLVAVLLFAILIPTSQWIRLAGEHQTLSGPQEISTLLPLSPVRSASPQEEPAVQLTLTADNTRVVFALDATVAAETGPLHIILLDPEGAVLWRSSATKPNATGQVLISLPSGDLVSGDHELHLEDVHSGKRVGSPYRVRILRSQE